MVAAASSTQAKPPHTERNRQQERARNCRLLQAAKDKILQHCSPLQDSLLGAMAWTEQERCPV